MKKQLMLKGLQLLTLFLMTCLLTGCGNVGSIGAKSRAKEYIKDKYGIEAKVSSSRKETVSGLFKMDSTGRTLVELKADDKIFYVLVGSTELEPCYDNYQAEEITNAFADEVIACIGKEPDICKLIYDNNTDEDRYYDGLYDNLFHTYYDGDNLYEVLSEGYDVKFTAVFTDGTMVHNIDLSPVIFAFSEGRTPSNYDTLYINLYSFNSKEAFEKDKECALSNEVHPFSYQLKLANPDLCDAQVIDLKCKEAGKGRITVTNLDYQYSYDKKDKSIKVSSCDSDDEEFIKEEIKAGEFPESYLFEEKTF